MFIVHNKIRIMLRSLKLLFQKEALIGLLAQKCPISLNKLDMWNWIICSLQILTFCSTAPFAQIEALSRRP